LGEFSWVSWVGEFELVNWVVVGFELNLNLNWVNLVELGWWVNWWVN
jgi:hypothetical protein